MPDARVRRSVIAGSWYPGDRETLIQEVDGFLRAAELPEDLGRVIALVAPHAGYRYSGAAAGYAYAAVRGHRYRRVILLAPSHYSGFRGASITDHDAYRTPFGDVPLDREVCDRLLEDPLIGSHPEAHTREHSLEIQLPFLQRALGEFVLVPLVVGQVDAADMDEIAEAVRPFVGDETLVVASSDFTHYGDSFGYVPFRKDIKENLSRLDGEAIKLIVAGDYRGLADYHERTGITVCGIRPISILLRLLPKDASGKLLRYFTSGDLTDDWSHCVSYAAICISKGPESESVHREGEENGRMTAPSAGDGLGAEAREYLLRAARRSLIEAVRKGKGSGSGEEPATHLSRLWEKSGAFVTLEIGGRLRGCIGYIEPRMPLYRAVAENAANAALNDPRFPRVTEEELDKIHIEISVLSPPEPIGDPSGFEVGKHGIILEKGRYRSVYLPQVAPEQGWDREETLTHLALKAGLPPDGWREGASLYVFTAEVFAEDE